MTDIVDQDAVAWDARVTRALERGPARLRNAVEWLRAPSRRWVRIPAGIALIFGGLLAVLPVFGLWMLPLGLALLGEDIPVLKGFMERVTRGVERLWRRLRR